MDTTYSIDSVWRGDTLFLYKVRHITVRIDDDIILVNKTDLLKLSNFTPSKNDIIRYNFIAENQHPYNNAKNTNFYLNGFSPFVDFGKFYIKSSNIENDTNKSEIINSGIGFLLNFKSNKFSYSTGFSLSNYYEKYNFSTEYSFVNSNFHQNIKPNTFWTVDTQYYLNLDTLLLTGDTIYYPIYDSNFHAVYDTLSFYTHDTSKFTSNFNKTNTLSYIEIPLLFSKNFKVNNFEISPQVGFIFGFYYFSDFKINTLKYDQLLTPVIAKMTYYAYFSTNINYLFNNKIGGFLRLWSKIPINQQYSINKINYKYYSFGLSLGLTYNIK